MITSFEKMKINESANFWSKEKIEKLYDDFYDMVSSINEYLQINHKDLFKKTAQNYNLRSFWFEEDEEGLFNVSFENFVTGWNHDFSYTFSEEEFQDLLIFMNDPRTYKNAKKYNI